MQPITDNIPWTEIGSFGLTSEDIINLEKIANIPIKDIRFEDNPNLLVFPRDFGVYGDAISESEIVSIQGGYLRTGNIMGFVGYNGTELNIRSRFSKEDSNDYFLHYLLQKVFAINLFELKHLTADESIFDFLLYLFPFFLKRAVSQGVFRKYETRAYNDSRVKGRIDVPKHLRMNVPFNGHVSYNCREYTYDNEVTELIRHTIEFIRTKPQGPVILGNDEETKSALLAIESATPSYSAKERQLIVNQNLRPIRHPYFSEYAKLQQLCVRILRHESLKYGEQDNRVYGILFDGAWLWEEYLMKILFPYGFEHPKNKTRIGGIRMFLSQLDEERIQSNNRRLYPDFYKKNCIVDAKYKHLHKGVGREDLYQVVTYMYCMHSEFGGYIYPLEKLEEAVWYKLSGYEKGNEGEMFVVPFFVPQDADDWKQYSNLIMDSEKALEKEVEKCWDQKRPS